jgi:membrane protease YdiL (CAAX protease family)
MLFYKPWKMEAILRLLASIVICILFGSLVVTTIQFFEGPAKADRVLFSIAAIGASGMFGGALFILRRSWTFENFMRNYAGLVICTFAGLLLMWRAMHLQGPTGETGTSTLRIVVAVLGFQGATLLLVSRFLREHGTNWKEGFGLNIDWPRAVMFGLALAPAFLPVGWGLQWASEKIMEHVQLHPEEQTAVEALRNSETPLNSVVLGIAAILLAPVAEETIFRGILYPAIKQRGFPRLALWGTSIAFGIIHLNLAALLPLIVLAMLLAWLYEKTDNLAAPIVAHSLFNALNFAMVYVIPIKIDPAGSP